MNDLRQPVKRRSFSPPVFGSLRWAALVVLLSSASSIGRAQDGAEPDEGKLPAAEERAASNESVSIDTPRFGSTPSAVEAADAAPPPAGKAERPADAGEEEPDSLTEAVPVSSDEQSAKAATTSSHAIRKRPAGDWGAQLIGGRSTPWYRTGLGALSVVLALVGVAFFLARRYLPSLRLAEGGVLRVVTRTSLNSKQTLALIQLGRRFVMVAVSPNRVDVLSEISDPTEVAELTARTGAAWPSGGGTFDRLLNREADDFRRTSLNSLETTDPMGGSPRMKTRGPVADLLTRLRALQRSH